jgi:hypothetical protein
MEYLDRKAVNRKLLGLILEKLSSLRAAQSKNFTFIREKEISKLSIEASKIRRELSKEEYHD